MPCLFIECNFLDWNFIPPTCWVKRREGCSRKKDVALVGARFALQCQIGKSWQGTKLGTNNKGLYQVGWHSASLARSTTTPPPAWASRRTAAPRKTKTERESHQEALNRDSRNVGLEIRSSCSLAMIVVFQTSKNYLVLNKICWHLNYQSEASTLPLD